MRIYVREKMRELARLVLEARKSHPEANLWSLIHPSKFSEVAVLQHKG